MKKRILGLDTGTNSLGWAVVDKFENGKYELIKKGSLIFQEGVKIEKGIESSKASERTQHKSLRKQYFRRRLRKIEVLKVLVRNHLCPALTEEQLHEWHIHKVYPKSEAFLEWQRTNENEEKNPYYYRYRCLFHELDLSSPSDRYILGRAIYHLSQRRGFISNRLDNSEENEKETGKVKSGISDLSKEMKANGCSYIGEYFYYLYKKYGNTTRIRTRYTDREVHYLKEFHAICEKQHLTPDLAKELEKAIYFQRPLKSQKKGVGHCTFEPGRPRCLDSNPAFEEFRMWSFIDNIKIQGPQDEHLRRLNKDEIDAILPKFYRKSRNFDFEVLAKAIAGANNYQYVKDSGDKPYKFNFRMTQSVSSNTTCAAFREIWGEDFGTAIAESYSLMQNRDGSIKSIDEAVNDVWNALVFMETTEKVRKFGTTRLQLTEEQAESFSKIRLSHSYSSLSYCAISKILHYLRKGYKYSHAVLLANVPTIVGKDIWNDDHNYIEQNLREIIRNYEYELHQMKKDGMYNNPAYVLEDLIKDFLSNNFDLLPGAIDKLYHPSMIDVYPDAKQQNGVFQLGSPKTDAIRNPMAMRSLHEVRKVVNELLREKIIDSETEVHIEYARELNDANKRKAINDWAREREKKRKRYEEEIKKLFKEATGQDIVPTEDDILKFELWEEQGHVCLYTGENIGITDFLGSNPKYDIEHTIPQSVGGDSSMMNLTLCNSRFNREIKGAHLPSELANHEDILIRIDSWRKKFFALTKDLDTKYRTYSGMEKSRKDGIIQRRHLCRLERDYWRGKVERFTMTEVPEGFSLRQGIGIGLISKYAGLYLKSLFHKANYRDKSNVRIVKGLTTAEFRKMWGIQGIYEQKSRDNHVHHCIDAITIACIDGDAYNKMAHYYHEEELHQWGQGPKPSFPKPWPTFTEDIKNLADSVIVVHDTPDNMLKKSKYRKVQTPTKKHMAQGDAARGALHNDFYYGAIEKDGEIVYVIRRPLSSFSNESDIENIIDDVVKQKVKDAVALKGFKKAISEPIYMNESKGIVIRKVRCKTPVKTPLNIREHRDASKKDYKRQFHVVNDHNYLMGIYRGEQNGKIKSAFEMRTMLDAVSHYKASNSSNEREHIVPSSKSGLPLVYTLKIGTIVILYENHPDEIDFSNVPDINQRLYKVVGLNMNRDRGREYGMIVLRHCQEARIAKDIPGKKGAYQDGETYRPTIIMNHNQFRSLVDGVHFTINRLGEVKAL